MNLKALKALKYKIFWKSLGTFLGIVLAAILAVIIYIFFGAWLISVIFSTTFTVLQFISVNILLWLMRGVYKFATGVKLEK